MDSLRITATAHGLNYLPEYWAQASGRFAEQNLVVTARARDPWTGVLEDLADGSADLALGGLWVPAMYYGKGRDLVVVGQLNARFPMVILTREPVAQFSWEWMKGRTVLAPGAGGSAPYEFTAGLMREAGVAPSTVRFVRDLSTDMLAELFTHGLGDAMIADLLSATRLEQAGVGHISCRIADLGGPMPNSVYYVLRERLEGVIERISLFLGGLRKGMEDLNTGVVDTLPLLVEHWPKVPAAALVSAAAELSSNGTWASVRVEPGPCGHWISILQYAGLVEAAVPYDGLVDTRAMDVVDSLSLG